MEAVKGIRVSAMVFPNKWRQNNDHMVEGTSVTSISGKKWYDLAKKTVSQQNPRKSAAKVILRPQHSPSKKTPLDSIRSNIKIQITEYPIKRHIIVININFARRQKMHILNIDLLVLCN
jgi:hypothetical protein